jgi:CRISPR/Cas system-associated endonuclease Cas1
MANTQLSPPDVNFVNSLRAVADQGGSGSQLTAVANYGSISALRGALNTANAAYYTVARLDQLTVNDMIFALRNIQDPQTIANYMTASAA